MRSFDKSDFFRPEAVLVAELCGRIVGFAVGTVRGGQEGRIPLLFVDPAWQDTPVPDNLLARILDCFRGVGLSRAEAGTAWETGLSDCGYDTRYVDALAAFSRNGFKRVWSDQELDVDIVKDLRGLEIPQWVLDARARLESEGMRFNLCEAEMKREYLEFMLQDFGTHGGWCTRAKLYVDSHEEPGFHLLARLAGDIVGFTECVFDADWHIYATGVRESLRRKKTGSVLVFLSLDEMRRRGAEKMYVGEAPRDFYHILGGQVLRRYMVMSTAL